MLVVDGDGVSGRLFNRDRKFSDIHVRDSISFSSTSLA